jgi:hypothetical protein
VRCELLAAEHRRLCNRQHESIMKKQLCHSLIVASTPSGEPPHRWLQCMQCETGCRSELVESEGCDVCRWTEDAQKEPELHS